VLRWLAEATPGQRGVAAADGRHARSVRRLVIDPDPDVIHTPQNPATLRVASVMQTRASASDVPDATRRSEPRS
jgi:hypothetical protein